MQPTTTGLTALVSKSNTAHSAATGLAQRAGVTLTASLVLAAIVVAPTPGHSVTSKQARTIMSAAEGMLGFKYSYGAKNSTTGPIDCSGLTAAS